MPLARHDGIIQYFSDHIGISTHMPLARHDGCTDYVPNSDEISTHMPLARHDTVVNVKINLVH